MADQDTPPIIIKKVVGHGGHHGGAWKVAYADFVTAMMALFIVLWLMSSSAEVKHAVGGYFQDPTGKGKQTGSAQMGSGESLTVSKTDMSKLKERLHDAVKEMPEFAKFKNQIQMTVTGEGLRVELLETENGMFFESGNARPTGSGEQLLSALATELGRLPNTLLIEGHTDATGFSSQTEYTNWELSTDRANAARRFMEGHGLRPSQVKQVRGFADQNLRDPEKPEDASNRRVSVIVQYLNAPDRPTAAPQLSHGGEKAEHAVPKEAHAPSGEHKPAAGH